LRTLEVPIKDRKNPPSLKFPDQCVNCGKLKSVALPIKLDMGVEKRRQGVQMDFPVPLCAECEAKERSVTYVTLVPFVIVGFLCCAIAFVPAWLISPEGNTPQTYGSSLVIGTFIGMIVGVIGGTIFEFVLKLLLAPAYGRLLLKRPLTIFSLLNDSEDVIGLSAKFTKERKSLMLTFENDAIANEFESMNVQEKK
jgi:hypothetical protein